MTNEYIQKQKELDLELLMSILSHDMRASLGAISDLSKSTDETNLYENINKIKSYSHNAKKIIEDTISFVELSSRYDEPEEIDLNELLGNVSNSIQESTNKTELKLTVDTLPKVKAHNFLLTTIFINLILNAVKYTDKPTAEVRIFSKEVKGKTAIGVKDNGIGIEERHFEKIFKPFHRVYNDGRYPGTGIGLSMCKKAVELLGGEIWVESTPGVSSTFYFTLAP